MATQQEIDAVIEATDVVSLVSEYVKLDKQGKNYKGLCPFHNEDTPSFVVSPEKHLAHCFGCGGGGNPIQFLQDIEHIEFSEALNKLAKRAGITISGYTEKKTSTNFNKYYQITQLATKFYSTYLNSTKPGLEAKEYLAKRGITDDIIERFKIGLAPASNDSLYLTLKDNGHLEIDIADLGLIDKNPKGYYDLFQKRIMFPICDEIGNVIAFSGRIYNNTDKNQPKYVNSRESVLFHKGLVLFNLNNARGEIAKKKRVILHEGQMDVIAANKAGFTEAVCTLGTALSIDHANILKKYTDNVVICFDGDGAGIRAAIKAIKIFRATGFNIHLVLLPDKMDPDEYVGKFGPDGYKDYFESNQLDEYAYVFETTVLDKDLTDVVNISYVKERIFKMVLQAKSKTIEELYLKKLANKLNVSAEAVDQDYKAYCKNVLNPELAMLEDNPDVSYYEYQEEEPIAYRPKDYNSICELRLIQYAKASKASAMSIDWFLSDRMSALSLSNQKLWIKLINEYYETYQEFDEGIFLKMLDPELLEHYLKMVEELGKYKSIAFDEDDMMNCIKTLKIVQMDVDNKMLNEKIYQTDDIAKKGELISEKFKNKKNKEKLKREALKK